MIPIFAFETAQAGSVDTLVEHHLIVVKEGYRYIFIITYLAAVVGSWQTSLGQFIVG